MTMKKLILKAVMILTLSMSVISCGEKELSNEEKNLIKQADSYIQHSEEMMKIDYFGKMMKYESEHSTGDSIKDRNEMIKIYGNDKVLSLDSFKLNIKYGI